MTQLCHSKIGFEILPEIETRDIETTWAPTVGWLDLRTNLASPRAATDIKSSHIGEKKEEKKGKTVAIFHLAIKEELDRLFRSRVFG